MKILPSAKGFLFICLILISVNANAVISNADVLDNALGKYSAVASGWGAAITANATWLFWTLALISMVWTFGMLALRKADIAEFYSELIRFTVFTGFFWWLLSNGPRFAISIIDSLRQIGGSAAGTGPTLTPSGVVDIGFDIFFRVLDQSTVWSPVDSTAGIIMSLGILLVLALVGVNMLVLLISAWILAYAGVFFLGFGGSRWTSDMAISYFKTTLSIAAQLMAMVLLVGIGQSFVDEFYKNMSAGLSLKELGIMLVVSSVLLMLVNKVPPLLGQIPMGGGTGAIGNGFGAGAGIAAGAAAGAAAATAAAMMGAGAANIGGGASALMAAFNQASNSVNSSGGGEMSSPSSGSGGNSSGGSPLAMAMDGSSPPSAGSSPSSSTSGGSSSKGTSVANAGKVAAGTVSNLFQGGKDVAKEAIQGRISNTVGGKIAEAINSRGEANNVPITESNSLSAGSEQVDREAEIAAFVNREA
jgi:type IV secretion system protein TrbL